MFKKYVGIDISKDTFDVCVLNSNLQPQDQLKLKMNRNGFKKLELILSDSLKSEVLIVMEATGIYYFTLLYHLLDKKYKVSIVNPILINNFIKSETLRKSKTDKKDALLISKFAFRFNATLHIISEKSLNSLKPIIRERESITKDISRLKSGIKGELNILFPELPKKINIFTRTNLELIRIFPSAKQVIKYSEKQIKKMLHRVVKNKLPIDSTLLLELAETSIGVNASHYETVLISKVERLLSLQKELSRFNKILEDEINDENNNDFNILSSINGIGNVTAKTFIIELNDINRFKSAKQVTAYFGTDPSIKQSGSSVNKNGRITKRGNSHLRRIIWHMAVGVIRYDENFRNYYMKKREQGMKYKMAVIATGNKLIRVLFGMLKSRTLYVPNMT